MTVHTVQLVDTAVHRSFRLTRSGAEVRSEVHADVVLSAAEARALLATAKRFDVAEGGCFSAGPGGVQVWDGPWNGDAGRVGTAQHLGSVDWSWDTPIRDYATVYRVLLTTTGTAAGLTTHTLLGKVLALIGHEVPSTVALASFPVQRDPFKSEHLNPRLLTDLSSRA